jgi:hypothetical protein
MHNATPITGWRFRLFTEPWQGYVLCAGDVVPEFFLCDALLHTQFSRSGPLSKRQIDRRELASLRSQPTTEASGGGAEDR